jgi:hypothetical protein
MAYPTVSKPYGLQTGQFDRRSGLCRCNSLSSYCQRLCTRQSVLWRSGYSCQRTALLPVLQQLMQTTTGLRRAFAGVFLGCDIRRPQHRKQVQFQQQYFRGGITPATGTFINAYRLLMTPTRCSKMAVVSGTTVVTGVQVTSGVGQNSTLSS